MKVDFAPPVGPWTAHHTLGAAVVLSIAAAITVTIWPGWSLLARLVLP
jgi:hypothetical protein